MLVTLIGIPLLLLLLLFSRVISGVERGRARPAPGHRRPLAVPAAPRTGTCWASIKALVTDPAAWKAGLRAARCYPSGIVSFSLPWCCGRSAWPGVTFPLYGWALTSDAAGSTSA